MGTNEPWTVCQVGRRRSCGRGWAHAGARAALGSPDRPAAPPRAVAAPGGGAPGAVLPDFVEIEVAADRGLDVDCHPYGSGIC